MGVTNRIDGRDARFAYSLGINEVVFVALDERAYELRRDQLDGVSELAELTCHPMRTCAGLHDSSTRMERGEELKQLLPRYLLAKHDFAYAILPMQMERMLAQINPNHRDVVPGNDLPRKGLSSLLAARWGDHPITALFALF
ncbi:hypothetical protein WS45_28400 [Burkholderia sp. RF2-non_BP3]|nr:hypothetical protein WS45_28400 [Burkholderia sp. RF2-non_BP3]